MAAATGPEVHSNLDSSRPSSEGGYRFGQLSRNAFFARHNPNPKRVCHMKGLLGAPICYVNDDPLGQPNNFTRATDQFPPQSFTDFKVKYGVRGSMPVGMFNMAGPSRVLPNDTIRGLQFFTGLRNHSFREKAVPNLGMVPVTENWREELRYITESAVAPFAERLCAKQQEQQQEMEEGKVQHPAEWMNVGSTSKPASAGSASGVGRTPCPLYSPATGRLIPPSSRANLSRRSRRSTGGLRTPATPGLLPHYEHISLSPDIEAQIFTMLCGILQTEDVYAVQSWLSSASDREKALVLDIIRAALTNREEYYTLNPEGVVKPVPDTPALRDPVKLPPINEMGEADIIGASPDANRMLVHSDPPEEDEAALTNEDEACRPPTSAAFESSPRKAQLATVAEDKPATSQSSRATPKLLEKRPSARPVKHRPGSKVSQLSGDAEPGLKTPTPAPKVHQVKRADKSPNMTQTEAPATPLLTGGKQTTWNPESSTVI